MSLSNCTPSTFTDPSVFGTEILSISAVPVFNYTTADPVNPSRSFCNVTVTYAHPGTDDSINVETWFPPECKWNERYMAVGGGGLAAGRMSSSYSSMADAIAQGFVTSSTDAGVNTDQINGSWALLSPGNVDLHKAQDFGSKTLNDQALINKQLIKEMYGKPPAYSYFVGCSQGGRQGLKLAQRYPTAYDGIAAAAPAVLLGVTGTNIYVPQQYMNVLGEYPYPCEFDAIREAVVEACDGLDGVVDGVVDDVEGCLEAFNPFDLVGDSIDCPQAGEGVQVPITLTAASVANSSWTEGKNSVGQTEWYAFTPSTDLTGNFLGQLSTAATNCSGDGGCVGLPQPLGTEWMRLFVGQDPDFDYANLTMDEFMSMTHAASSDLSFMNAADPDLSAFRDAGGKMVTFHGMDDQLIPHTMTRRYYKEVMSLLPDVHDFYRLFEVPGLAHCRNGAGGRPGALVDQLQEWVEEGIAPDDTPVKFTDAEGTEWSRIMCPFPQTSKYQSECGDATSAECWSCEG